MSQKEKWRRRYRWVNWYLPFLGAGIRVREINADITRIEVEMRLRWYNRNLVGTHFGGSLFAMCDPHFMFMVMMNLGEDFVVWDKSAVIRFLRPGKGTVRAVFELSQDQLETMREEVGRLGKRTYWFSCQVQAENGSIIAEVDKEIYVRRKKKIAQA